MIQRNREGSQCAARLHINPVFTRYNGSSRTKGRDIDAVRNALTECWNNGQTEEQINRLKTLKRAMYDRASTELPRTDVAATRPKRAQTLRKTLLFLAEDSLNDLMSSALAPHTSDFEFRVEGFASGPQVAGDKLPHRRNQRSLSSAGGLQLSVVRV